MSASVNVKGLMSDYAFFEYRATITNLTHDESEGESVHCLIRIRRAESREEKFAHAFGLRPGERLSTGEFGLSIDITDRKEAEAALARSEVRLALSVEAADLGTFCFHR